jgi:hypothetical protein
MVALLLHAARARASDGTTKVAARETCTTGRSIMVRLHEPSYDDPRVEHNRTPE